MEPPEEPQRGAEPGEKAINIRLDKLNTSDEVLDLIRNVAKTTRRAYQRATPRSFER